MVVLAAVLLCLASAAGFALWRGIGLAIVVVLASAGTLLYGVNAGGDTLMAIMFVTSMGSPIFLGAVGLGVWAGVLWRDGQWLWAVVLLLAVVVAATILTAVQGDGKKSRAMAPPPLQASIG